MHFIVIFVYHLDLMSCADAVQGNLDPADASMGSLR
jgi:hypothetical protein